MSGHQIRPKLHQLFWIYRDLFRSVEVYRTSFTRKKKQIHSLIFLWKIKGIGNAPTLASSCCYGEFSANKNKTAGPCSASWMHLSEWEAQNKKNSFIPLPWRFSKNIFSLNGRNNVNCKMKTRPTKSRRHVKVWNLKTLQFSSKMSLQCFCLNKKVIQSSFNLQFV